MTDVLYGGYFDDLASLDVPMGMGPPEYEPGASPALLADLGRWSDAWSSDAWNFAPGAVPRGYVDSAGASRQSAFPVIRITRSTPADVAPAGVSNMDYWNLVSGGVGAVAPAGDAWANIYGGDPVGGVSWPSSDPLGVYDALRYGGAPSARAPASAAPRSFAGFQLPKLILPGTTTPAAGTAPAAMSSSLLLYGGLALLVVLLVKRK